MQGAGKGKGHKLLPMLLTTWEIPYITSCHFKQKAHLFENDMYVHAVIFSDGNRGIEHTQIVIMIRQESKTKCNHHLQERNFLC